MAHRFSVESGGALYNAGVLAVSSTVFTENIAGEGGLAIHDEGSSLVLENVTFVENMFSCPVDQYADAHHVSAFLIIMSTAVTSFSCLIPVYRTWYHPTTIYCTVVLQQTTDM